MPELGERRVFDADLRAVDRDGRRTMVGMAAPYNDPAAIGHYVEVLAPGVFAKSIQEAARNLPLMMFHQHDTYPVGRSVGWEETGDGLVGTWEFDTADEAAKAARAAEDGLIRGLSVGFMPVRNDVDPGDETTPPTVIRREARLLEVSMVPVPAYAKAQVMLVRTQGIEVPKPRLEQWKRWWLEKGAAGG